MLIRSSLHTSALGILKGQNMKQILLNMKKTNNKEAPFSSPTVGQSSPYLNFFFLVDHVSGRSQPDRVKQKHNVGK